MNIESDESSENDKSRHNFEPYLSDDETYERNSNSDNNKWY